MQISCSQNATNGTNGIYISNDYNVIIKENNELEFIEQEETYVAPNIVTIVNDTINLSSFNYCVPSAASEYKIKVNVNISDNILKLTSFDSCFINSTKAKEIYHYYKKIEDIKFDSILIETYEVGKEKEFKVFRSKHTTKLNQTKYLQLSIYLLHNPHFKLFNRYSSHGRKAIYTMFYNGKVISLKQTTSAPYYLYSIYKFSE